MGECLGNASKRHINERKLAEASSQCYAMKVLSEPWQVLRVLVDSERSFMISQVEGC